MELCGKKIPGAVGVSSVNAFTGAVQLYPELTNNDLTIVGNSTVVDLSKYLDDTDNQTTFN